MSDHSLPLKARRHVYLPYLQKFSVIAESKHCANSPRVNLMSQIVEDGNVVIVNNVKALSFPERENKIATGLIFKTIFNHLSYENKELLQLKTYEHCSDFTLVNQREVNSIQSIYDRYFIIFWKFCILTKQVFWRGNKTDLLSCILWQSASKTVLNSSSVVFAVQVSIQCLITLER